MEPIWIDSHCHLEMLKGDVAAVLRKSLDQGMRLCITIGTDHESYLTVCRFCQDHDTVWGTLGIHPHHAAGTTSENLAWLKQEARSNAKIVGIGECGFDFYYHHAGRTEQEASFRAQLEIARELGLPVVIHAREADQETRRLLTDFNDGSVSGVFHCFTSSKEQAKVVLDAGFYISFNGICTFPQAEAIRELARFVPKDRLLLETDAPYLSPVPHRGKPNYPGNVVIVGTYLSKLLGMEAETLADQIQNNTLTLFSKRMKR